MKKIIISITIFSLILPWLTFGAQQICYDPFCTTGLIQNRTGLGNVEPQVIAARIINVALTILGIICLVLVFYAGFIWMLARGNEEQITKAQEILKGAVMGLIIILASYSIASYVFNNLALVSNAYTGPASGVEYTGPTP